jgi:hypothetical protein
MTFPPGIMWGCFGSLDILGYEEIKLARDSTVQKLVGPEPALGVSRQCKKKDEMLDRQSAYVNVPGSYHYSETGFKTDFRP